MSYRVCRSCDQGELTRVGSDPGNVSLLVIKLKSDFDRV